MGNTIYASFADASLAEKAAGALLDYGVRSEDLSVIRGHQDIQNIATSYDATSPVPVTEQAWTGENRNVEANRMGYTGNVYDTELTGLGDATAASELQAENGRYGNVAARAENVGEPSLYPDDREIENRQAMTESAVGHDPNRWEREDRNPAIDIERAAKEGLSTTTGADAGAGAAKGLAWGIGLGILAGIASITVPGFGLVVGGGALATAIGAAVGTAGAGAAAGAVTGYLKDQGMDTHVAADYEKVVKSGGALLAVTYPSGNVDERSIRQVLEKYGAVGSNQYPRGYMA